VTTTPLSTARTIDAQALRRAQHRMASAPEAPWLHQEVARRMAERLPLIKAQPATVLDWWSRAGGSQVVLRQAYPKTALKAVETLATLSGPTAAATKAPQTPWWRRWTSSTPSLADADVPERGAELVWANMVLHHSADPGALMVQWRRALTVDGFLMLSTLGPDTLRGLRELYRDAGWGSPHAAFIDMHDIGDMLVGSGLAGPVMDQEMLTLTWASPEALMAELRSLGINADPARQAGWRTPRWRARLAAALRERAGTDGRIALGFEIVYGHAFNPPPRAKVASQTEVSLDDMRALVKQRAR
jgi:malonyl-CoA O-methyltransferase